MRDAGECSDGIAQVYKMPMSLSLNKGEKATLRTVLPNDIGKRDNKRADLIYLAEAIILICLWVVFDTPLFQIVCVVYFFDGIASFMLVTIMVLPFCSYFDAITDRRSHLILSICKIVMLFKITSGNSRLFNCRDESA